jgi:hypothetical protein
MGNRRNRKLLSSAAPLMAPGEQVQLIACAKLGSAPVAANVVGGVAAAVALSVLGGGAGFVGFAQREAYILLTDRQLLFFASNPGTGGPGKHLASVHRGSVLADEPRSTVFGLFVKLRLAIAGMSQPLDLTFPPLPPSLRRQGRLLAGALRTRTY